MLLTVAAVASLASCSGPGSPSSSRGAEPAKTDGSACNLLHRQVASVTKVSSDLIGLSRAAVNEALREREQRIRDLAAVDEEEASLLLPVAHLIAAARPEVVADWGDNDGADLHDRAFAGRTFHVIPQALLEAGDQEDAKRWPTATANASWAIFRLAARCDHLPTIPAGLPSSVPVGGRPPVPLFALDLSVGGQPVRVGADGVAKAIGPEHLRLHFPALSPDRKRIVAQTVTDGRQSQQVRVVTPDGTVAQEFDRPWDCGGWFADGTLVLGTYVGDVLHFESASTPRKLLPIQGSSCPAPGTTPDTVFVVQGRTDRDDAWVRLERIADGTTVNDIRLPGCTLVSPAASPDGSTVAMAAGCSDPTRQGIWIADTSGKLSHILTCICGVPAWSPDGDWISYVVTPTNGTDGLHTRLGFARPDGSAAFHLPDGYLSFPIWPSGPPDGRTNP